MNPMTAPTPGPWYVSGSNTEGICVFASGLKGAAVQIARVDTTGVNGAGMTNARLIAAAPEMLSTLRALLPDGKWYGETFNSRYAAIRDLLARLEGE